MGDMRAKGLGSSLTVVVVLLVIFYTWFVLWTRNVDRSIKAASQPIEEYSRDYYKDPATGLIAKKPTRTPATLPMTGEPSPAAR